MYKNALAPPSQSDALGVEHADINDIRLRCQQTECVGLGKARNAHLRDEFVDGLAPSHDVPVHTSLGVIALTGSRARAVLPKCGMGRTTRRAERLGAHGADRQTGQQPRPGCSLVVGLDADQLVASGDQVVTLDERLPRSGRAGGEADGGQVVRLASLRRRP